MIPSREDVLEVLATLEIPPVDTQRLERLESIIQGALTRAAYSSEGSEPGPVVCAAYLLHSLGKVHHPLIDGNKRFAWAMTQYYLIAWHAVGVEATDDDATTFVMHVADESEQPTVDDIRNWIGPRLRAVEMGP